MTGTTHPRYPIFIVSRGRAEIATTPEFLDRIGVDYRLIVEDDERDAYSARWGAEKVVVLDPQYQRDYETLDELGDSLSYGPGPARNFAWACALDDGAPWHWVMDDNIKLFATLTENVRNPVGDGTIFHAMETFATRYRNVAMAGPQYWMFAPSRTKWPPFVVGTRIYSCNLLRNDVGFRWRGRWNEDTILSLDLLKAGWNTVQFNAFLQYKLPTQTLPGGNTDAFYAEMGTLAKSQMLVAAHPDVSSLSWRYGRAHHFVNYRRFQKRPLIRRDDVDETPGYELRKVRR